MKKIMFNERFDLNRAVLQGEKTNTRRDGHRVYLDYERGRSLGDYPTLTLEEYAMQKSPFKVGEIVAVAQSYKALGYDPMFCPPGHEDGLGSEEGWSNKMYVSADLCKHHIRIDAVKFERLQEITDEEILKEGIMEYYPYIDRNPEDKLKTYRFRDKKSKYGYYQLHPARDCFAELIDRISGKGTWEANRYVYAYSFTLID